MLMGFGDGLTQLNGEAQGLRSGIIRFFMGFFDGYLDAQAVSFRIPVLSLIFLVADEISMILSVFFRHPATLSIETFFWKSFVYLFPFLLCLAIIQKIRVMTTDGEIQQETALKISGYIDCLLGTTYIFFLS